MKTQMIIFVKEENKAENWIAYAETEVQLNQFTSTTYNQPEINAA